MKVVITIILSCAILLATTNSKNVIGGRIIGGETARAAQFPWQVAVHVDREDGKYFCGGSLITPTFVLTAAHCLHNARWWTVLIGSTTLEGQDPIRVMVATSTGTMFPDFNPETLEHDIGLIHLHMPLQLNEYIQPIELAELGDIEDGMTAIAAGWGQISDSEAGYVNDLRYVNVAIISNEECSLTYGDQIKATMICTMGNYNEGICTGDTGGPLVIEKGFNNYVQVAVGGFFSQQGCEALHPSGYTRTDLYKEWIDGVIASENL